MKHQLAILLLAVMVGVGSAAESKEEQDGDDRQNKARPARQQQRRDRYREIVLKDPADFSKSQVKQVFSGPQPGEVLPPLMATGVGADHDGKQIDVVALAEGKPQVLFLLATDGVAVRGLFGFARLASTVEEKSNSGLHVAAVFLGDDPAELSNSVGRYAKLLSTKVDVLAISREGRDGPGTYGLNRNISETIIVAKDGKVVHNFVFPQGMLGPDPHVLGALADVIGEERETVTAWLHKAVAAGDRMAARGERMRTQDDNGSDARRGAMRQLLGKFVEAGKISRDEARQLFETAFPSDDARER